MREGWKLARSFPFVCLFVRLSGHFGMPKYSATYVLRSRDIGYPSSRNESLVKILNNLNSYTYLALYQLQAFWTSFSSQIERCPSHH